MQSIITTGTPRQVAMLPEHDISHRNREVDEFHNMEQQSILLPLKPKPYDVALELEKGECLLAYLLHSFIR